MQSSPVDRMEPASSKRSLSALLQVSGSRRMEAYESGLPPVQSLYAPFTSLQNHLACCRYAWPLKTNKTPLHNLHERSLDFSSYEEVGT